jgi:hypothetical protein
MDAALKYGKPGEVLERKYDYFLVENPIGWLE